jgi:ATP-binding cassette subfamily B protein
MHFVVLWSTFGPWVQLLDPATGRRWERKDRLLARLPDVQVTLSEERFAQWRKTSFAREPLRERLSELGVSAERGRNLVEDACTAASFRPYATLDAATRMVHMLVAGAAIGKREAARLLEGAIERAESDGIPVSFWWIWQSDTPGMLSARGAPIVRFNGRAAEASSAVEAAVRTSPSPRTRLGQTSAPTSPRELPLEEHAGGSSLFWSLLTLDRRRDLLLLLGAVLLAAGVAALDLVLLQALLHTVERLFLPYYRAGAALALIVLSLCGLSLEWAVVRLAGNLGRRLELRLRAALFEALPKLPEEYLRTRPTSDMAERGHSLHLLRRVPETTRRLFEALVTLFASAAGIAWLFPAARPLVALAGFSMLALPWALSRSACEKLARARSHGINLERFHLDALLGVVPIRVHAAEKSVRREHESLLVSWLRAMLSLHGQETLMQAYQLLGGAVLSIALVIWYLRTGATPSAALLIFYWSSQFPMAGIDYVNQLLTYRSLRLAVLRFFSPLRGARLVEGEVPAAPGTPAQPGVALSFRGVAVKAANRTVLSGIDLELPAGQHVAIVGASGAGKSSLVGLLLGWMKPIEGAIAIDGRPLDAASLRDLRAHTAWVDPAIQIWNDSLINNLLYGADETAVERLPLLIRLCELREVLENLPEGLQATLGEGGARLSGGQGQRVRLTRALIRSQVRLVILDEPFRGLQRPERGLLLQRVRSCFPQATLLFVSHDIRDTEQFERVLVVEAGRVVEDGAPALLKLEPSSRYRSLLEGDKGAHQRVWNTSAWRRVRMHEGKLQEQP